MSFTQRQYCIVKLSMGWYGEHNVPTPKLVRFGRVLSFNEKLNSYIISLRRPCRGLKVVSVPKTMVSRLCALKHSDTLKQES